MNSKRLGNNPFKDSPGGLSALISPSEPPAVKAPGLSPVAAYRVRKTPKHEEAEPEVKPKAANAGTSKSGLPEGYTRVTYIVQESQVKALKERAYIDRKNIKDVIAEAITEYLSKHEGGNTNA
jgi:hypothetical protein